MNDELYQFIAADYYATGEGRTVSLLITRAYPRAEDYDENQKQIRSAKFIAAREFIERNDPLLNSYAENLYREDFLNKYGRLLPEYVIKIINAEGSDRPGNFNYSQQYHLNFS